MKWFKSTKKQLEELINSDRYKNSKYEIQYINNSYYALHVKNSSVYVDLCNSRCNWYIADKWFKDCKGTLKDIIRIFNEVESITETMTSLKTL